MIMFCYMPIAVIFLHSFYIAVSYLRGAVPWPHPCRPFAKSETDLKERPIFLEIAIFLGRIIDKMGTDLKL